MKLLRVFLSVGVVLALLASSTFAAETRRVATIAEITGTAEVKIGSGKWAPAKAGMSLTQGDAIRTKINSIAILDLDGKARSAKVEMKENSLLTLAELAENKAENTQKTLLDLSLGKILIQVQKLRQDNSKFEVKTPTSVVGVRGTTFSVAVEAIE